LVVDVRVIEKPITKNDIEWEYIVFDPATHEYIDIRTGEVIPELSYITEEAYYNIPTTEEAGFGYSALEGVLKQERELFSTHKRIATGEIPREVVNGIIEEYRKGVPVMRIAEKYGVNVKTIYNILKSQGVEMKQKRTTQSEIEKILELYNKGYSISRIARELGMKKSTVYRIIKKNAKK